MTLAEKKRELPFSSSKHSGVISYFNRVFVRTGRFRRDLGRAFNKAFDSRSRGDYEEFVEVSQEEVESLLPLAEEFVGRARVILGEQQVLG